MDDPFNRKTQRVLKNHGVIAHTPSRLPGIFSFLLTGALLTAALLLTFSERSQKTALITTGAHGCCQLIKTPEAGGMG